MDEESIKSNIEISSNTLDEILSVQRPSSDKYGIGFDKEKKPGYSSFTNEDGNKRNYATALKRLIKKEESKKSVPLLQKIVMIPRGRMTSRHQQLFLGNCYTYNNFGHIARNCKLMVPIEKGNTSQSYFYNRNDTKIIQEG